MKFLRLLFLASSLACLASFSAQASDGLSLKKEDLHIKMEQPKLPATKNYEYLEQIKKLKKSQDYAKKTYNPTLELNALEKLALISGRSSKEYLIAYVRFKVNQGGKAREEAKEAVDKLCKMGKYTYECIQGKALYDISSPQMKIKLQSFNMHETNRDYEAAVKDMNELMGIPLEHSLRHRYFVMMGNIEEREREAITGLEAILKEDPTDSTFKFEVKKDINTFKAQLLANQAIKVIDDTKQSTVAQNKLKKAISIDPDNSNASYWKEILSYSTYYRMIEQADKLLEQNNVKAASALYLKATNILKDSPYAYVGLTRCAVLDKDVPSFEKYSNLAITNSKKESDAERKRIATSMVSLKGNLYSNIADDYQQKGDRENAVFYYMRALKIDNTSVWNAYALSNLLLDKGDRYTALKTIDEVSPSVKNTSEYAFAHALILDKTGDTKKAFEVLSPYKHTSQSIDENIERFEQTLALEKANKLYASGDLNGAIEAIEKYKVPYIETTKAQYQYEAGDLNHAVESLKDAIAKDNTQTYSKLRLAQIYHELGDDENASAVALSLKEESSNLSLDNQRALGELFSDLKRFDDAIAVYETGLKNNSLDHSLEDSALVLDLVTSSNNNKTANNFKAQDLEVSESEKRMTKAWMQRNIAVIEGDLYKNGTKALEDYRKALAIYDDKIGLYSDDKLYTKALRTPNDPQDWLRQSIASRGAEYYQEHNTVITDAIRFIRDSGHGGYSDNKGFINVLNISFHMLSGRVAFQTDRTVTDAGTLTGGAYNDMFGSCFATGCNDSSKHKRSINTYALSYDNEVFHIDVGTAPKISGNKVTSNALVGGFRTYFDYKDWSFTPYVYHRAVDNSLLSYFGDRDPVDGKLWGAVKKTGVSLTVSNYINEYSGIWLKGGIDVLKGTDVASNTKFSFMGGYYFHLIYRPNERLTLSPSAMYMHYNKDLSGYTFSQGGYYSPQQYYSTSLSLAYMRRYDDFSYSVEASLSLSHATTDSIDRYPLRSKYYLAEDYDAVTTKSSSTTIGGGITAVAEKRFGSHFVLGAQLKAIKSDDYSPLNGTLYFRYYMDAWEGDLPMPPSGPTPYVEW